MIEAYLIKANAAGVSQASQLRSIGIGWISPLSVIPGGIVLGLLLIALNALVYFVKYDSVGQAFLLRALLASSLVGYLVTAAIYSTFSLYIPESPFTYIILTLVFWWAVGKIALKTILQMRSSREDVFTNGLKLAARVW